jgi:hypothetical protein
MRPLLLGLAISTLAGAGCKARSDTEIMDLVTDLSVLDREIDETVRANPNDEGLGAAESLLAAKKPALRDRLASANEARMNDGPRRALAMSCAVNHGTASEIVDHIRNALVFNPPNPALVARASKLAQDLCAVCPSMPNVDGCDTIEKH